jgi:hypothetical protein
MIPITCGNGLAVRVAPNEWALVRAIIPSLPNMVRTLARHANGRNSKVQ